MQRKLTTMLFVCTLIPFSIIFAFAINSLFDNRLAEYNANTEKKLNGAVNIMNRHIDKEIMKSETISRSSIIIDGLQRDYKDDIMSVMIYYNELDMVMLNFSDYNASKCIIYPLNEDLPLGKYIGNIEQLKQSKEIWEKLNRGSNSVIVWDYSNASIYGGDSYISIYGKIYDYENLLGYFETRIYISELIYPLQNMSVEDGESIKCVSPDGVFFYCDEKNSEKKHNIKHTLYLNGGSMVSCSINKNNVLKDCYDYIVFYFIGFSLFIAALFLLYKRMISSVTKDLNKFIDLLRTNTDITPDDLLDGNSADSDIALIKQKFCDLLLKMKKMYSDIIDMNRTKRTMEMELLQSGINPHLLYNSLSVIRWQMIWLHQDELVEIIDNMSEYYRHILAGGDYIITIRDELELVDKYIKINELTYKNKYKIIKNIDEGVLDCPTIKLIMQPIVENAILHGLVDKEDGIIRISITTDGDNIVITIEDNGYGMSKEDVAKALDTNKVQRRKGGYGISNTIKRIKLYYGNDCGIEISSIIGEGTAVIIRIKNIESHELKKRLE